MKTMINRHFIKMLVLFAGILIIGFVIISFADQDNPPTSFASAVESILQRFHSGGR